MTKREYAEEIIAIIGKGEVQEVEKNNGVIKTGIVFWEEGKNIAPTVYVDDFYDNEIPTDVTVKRIEKLMEDTEFADSFDKNKVLNFSEAKDKLRVRLLNNTTKADIYKDAGEYGFDDLRIVPVVDLGEGAIVTVSEGIMRCWDMTPTEIIDIAMENARNVEEYSIIPMCDILIESMKGKMPEEMLEMFSEEIKADWESNPMYIISNKSKIYGAIGAIIIADQLKEKFPNGYIVIPSSIHEVIVIAAETDMDHVNQMIREVNTGHLRPEEVLGSKGYIFK